MFRRTMTGQQLPPPGAATARDGDRVTLECQRGVTHNPLGITAWSPQRKDNRLVRNFDEAAAAAVYAARQQQREDFRQG